VSDGQGAVRTLRELPYGTLLLVSAAIGLAAYALWRVLQAAIDLDHKRGWKGAGKRIAYAFSGMVYAGLAWTAFELARGHHAADHADAKKSLFARALSRPYGYLLILLVGIWFAGYGAVQLLSAITGRTHGMMLRIRPPRNAKPSINQSDWPPPAAATAGFAEDIASFVS
jgi:hypothetical protein